MIQDLYLPRKFASWILNYLEYWLEQPRVEIPVQCFIWQLRNLVENFVAGFETFKYKMAPDESGYSRLPLAYVNSLIST